MSEGLSTYAGITVAATVTKIVWSCFYFQKRKNFTDNEKQIESNIGYSCLIILTMIFMNFNIKLVSQGTEILIIPLISQILELLLVDFRLLIQLLFDNSVLRMKQYIQTICLLIILYGISILFSFLLEYSRDIFIVIIILLNQYQIPRIFNGFYIRQKPQWSLPKMLLSISTLTQLSIFVFPNNLLGVNLSLFIYFVLVFFNLTMFYCNFLQYIHGPYMCCSPIQQEKKQIIFQDIEHYGQNSESLENLAQNILKTQFEEIQTFKCSICLQNTFTVNKQTGTIEFLECDMISKTICNHYFHKTCIMQWISQNHHCPNCRKIIN